jgi:hypothetical protein
MTPLRKKMIKAMELRNLAKGTQYYYLLAVNGIARFYNQPPDTHRPSDIRGIANPGRYLCVGKRYPSVWK